MLALKQRLRFLRFKRLNQQLALLFIGLTGLGLLVYGLLAYNLASSSLEKELGLRLLSSAKLKASALRDFNPALVPGGAAAAAWRAKAALLAADEGLESVQILRRDGTVLIDTADPAAEGSRDLYLDLDLTEWELALNGVAKATPLFKGRGGRLFKSAFAPLPGPAGKDPKAVLRVQASADFLSELHHFGLSLLLLGFVSLGLALIAALLVSGPLVDPVQELASAAARVAQGDFSARVSVHRQDEIGQMSATFNEMAERLGAFMREKERLVTLGELAAGVVHEIRNPLAAIAGFAEILEGRLKAKDPSKAHLRKIQNEVRVVSGFLSDFLEYAKPRQPRLEKLDPCKVAEAALGVVLPGDKAKRWKASWEKRDKVLVRADADQLRQVLVNLLMNAREASPKGAPIHLGLEKSKGWARLWIRDEGRGISKDAMDKLFTPFYTSKPMGTGLGLSIAQKIVESLGGRVEAESRAGQGSRFTVVLPLKS
jgi:signal transduction histidine kinase